MNLGGGDLRSLIVLLIFGFSAYINLNSLIAIPHVALENRTDSDLEGMEPAAEGLDQNAGALFGVGSDTLRWLVALGGSAVILTYVFQSEAFRRSPRHVVSGMGVGTIIALGWFFTGHLLMTRMNLRELDH